MVNDDTARTPAAQSMTSLTLYGATKSVSTLAAGSTLAKAEPSTTAKLTGEFVGTFLLIFTAVNVKNQEWAGVAIASVLMVAIYAIGGISGANFNPAVSAALAMSKAAGADGIDFTTAGQYCGVQLVAGASAAKLAGCFFGASGSLEPFSPAVCLAEVFYTFMLCFVVLNVAVAKNKPNEYYGLAISSVIVAGAYGAGTISGGCFNPAVAVGINLAFMGGCNCVFYAAAELLGAVLAVGAFMVVRPQDFERQKTAATPLASELLGTFMLVLTVCLNVQAKSTAAAYSIAASLTSMIYALGDVSGAHFNPAVTAAILASGRLKDALPLGTALSYMVAQCVGAILAGACCPLLFEDESRVRLSQGDGFKLCDATLAECVFTFVLCYVVLSVAVSTKTKASVMFGLAIGACVTAGGNAIGHVSGGSLNPAVSLGIPVADYFLNADFVSKDSLINFLAYSLAEIMGAVGAAAVFKVTHAVDEAD